VVYPLMYAAPLLPRHDARLGLGFVGWPSTRPVVGLAVRMSENALDSSMLRQMTMRELWSVSKRYPDRLL
jgi:hypothetical protein